jgi:hypothetical protein
MPYFKKGKGREVMSRASVTYQPKDMFFNNGIVNLYRFLKEQDLEIEMSLDNSSLELKMDEKKADKLYFEILKGFFKEYKIVYQTKNDRWYFDEKKQDFILDKRFDVLGKSSGNDILSGVYHYKTPDELEIEEEDIKKKYLLFCKKNLQQPDLKDKIKISDIKKELNLEKDLDKNLKLLQVLDFLDNHKEKLNVPNGNNKVVLAITLDEGVENFTNYFVKDKGQFLKLDSKIHTFEDGQKTFHDMLKLSKGYKLDKWNALIYWFGGRVQKIYNSYTIPKTSPPKKKNYTIYPNSSDLIALEKFKAFLKISDENIQIRDKKGELKTTSSNIDFYKQLSKDNIHNPNFYISNSQEEFEVKFFMYLFSIIFHIEEQYEKANRRRKATKKEIYDALKLITFIIYTDDGTFKTSFNEYTKAYWLIKFFEILKKEGLFDYLATILVTFSMSQGSREVNLNLKRWSQKLLNFSDLRKEYYWTSFNILKNNSKTFGKKLFEFEKLYLKNILGEKNMNIHEQSKVLGDGIGHYCAELGDKDLLFKLRTIKNYKQLIGYFKDLKFSILKNEGKAKFSKEFNETLDEVLKKIENSWELIRDYMAIYAIDKYRAVLFAKSNQGDK